MSTFFLHNSEIYGYQIDPSIMTLNANNVITFNFGGTLPPAFNAAFETWMASLPTTPGAVGTAYNNGGVPAISQP